MNLKKNNIDNKAKNILLVVRWPVGGIRTFIRYVYKNFNSPYYKFTIIAPDLDELNYIKCDLSGVNVKFVSVKHMPTDGSSGFFLMIKAIIFEIIKNKYDIVHSHGFTSAICSSIPSFILNIPHIITSHDIINENQFIGFKGFVKKTGMGLLFNLSDCIHCVSFDARDNLLNRIPLLKKNKERIISIPNGLEIERFIGEGKEDFYKLEKVEDGDFLIGFFGRFMAQKGFRYLVGAVEILNKKKLPRRFKVLCFGWGGFIREDQKELVLKKIDNYFIFLPFRSNIADALRGVDLVVMPSLWEAYGLLAAETLVAGTPLIGTNCEGLREVLAGSPAQVVPPGDSEALAKAIVKEMTSSSRWKASRYRCEAAKRFDVTNQVIALKKVIESIC